jgi:AraC family transcriptional activator of tynA and feaB
MQTWYTYSGRDVAESRRALAAMVRDEFTDGDVSIEPSSGEVRAFIRRGPTQPITFMRSMNHTGISFRRSWHHIRSRKASVRLLYFILQGELQVVHSGGSYAVKPGRCAVINSDEPFLSQTVVGERGSFECALAVVPEHMVLSYMPWAKGLNTSFEVGAGHRHVVTNLLDLLCEGDRLSRRTTETLGEAFLQSISDSMGDHIAISAPPSSLVDKRFADLQACIQKYLTCADLTCDRVAAYCGISPRYLCYVLKANNTSFSELLWSQRLPKARDWLVSESFQRYPIHKIACMAGFKSAAHFSRMFKTAYNVSPKEYRASHVDAGTGAAMGDGRQARSSRVD